MGLIDDFAERLAELPDGSGSGSIARLADAHVMQIGNVAAYVEGLDLSPPLPGRTFAAVMPPFDNLWMEFPLTLPQSPTAPMGRKLRVGLWAVSIGPPTLPERGRLTARNWVIRALGGGETLGATPMFAGTPDWLQALPDETAGLVSFTVVMLPSPWPILATLFVPFDSAGNVCEVRENVWWHLAMPPEVPFDPMGGLALQIVVTGLYALSFLHCKNVSEEAHEADPRLQRARARRGKRPFFRYHTLHIHPVGRATRTASSDSTGAARSLHIVRGNFATYTAERPLFGRLTGTFWRPAHVRGDADTGVVDKAYEIHPSGEERRS